MLQRYIFYCTFPLFPSTRWWRIACMWTNRFRLYASKVQKQANVKKMLKMIKFRYLKFWGASPKRLQISRICFSAGITHLSFVLNSSMNRSIHCIFWVSLSYSGRKTMFSIEWIQQFIATSHSQHQKMISWHTNTSTTTSGYLWAAVVQNLDMSAKGLVHDIHRNIITMGQIPQQIEHFVSHHAILVILC